MDDNPILVVAGNFAQYERFRRDRRLIDHVDAIYVNERSEQIRGRRDCIVVFTGTWYERRDANDVYGRVMARSTAANFEIRNEPMILSDANAATQKFYADLAEIRGR